MSDMFTRISELGIVPVVKIEDARHAVPLAQALKQGGLPVAEITFRTDAAEEAIRAIAGNEPDILLGAGTVLTMDQAKRAIDAGARFIVAPGLNPKVVRYCLDQNVPITPGISNPTDIEAALDLGLNVLKFFPAEAFGGLKTLKAMSAPYGMIRFIPTGGINAGNLNDYLAFPKVLACGGSWMVKADLIAAEKFATIVDLVREAVRTMLGFRVNRIALPALDATESEAGQLADLLGLSLEQTDRATLLGGSLAFNRLDNGQNGELVIQTNSLLRAKAWLQRQGVSLTEADDGVSLEDQTCAGLRVRFVD